MRNPWTGRTLIADTGPDHAPRSPIGACEHDGEMYYFCGRGCKLDFEEEPAKFFDPSYIPSM